MRGCTVAAIVQWFGADSVNGGPWASNRGGIAYGNDVTGTGLGFGVTQQAYGYGTIDGRGYGWEPAKHCEDVVCVDYT